MSARSHVVLDSPIGPITVVAENETITGVYMEDQRHLPDPVRFGQPDDGSCGLLKDVEQQLTEYFAGTRTAFDLPLAATGTEFQRAVWAALSEIPYGETVSYGELARRIGKPAASRAVGLANGKNPISIVVPCHRVIGSSGKLVGYGGGLERKQTLLALERRSPLRDDIA